MSESNTIKILTTDAESTDFKAQVIRDLLLLCAEWQVELHIDSQVPQDIVYGLRLRMSQAEPAFSIVYSTNGEWPECEGKVVKRELFQEPGKGNLDPTAQPGYYLKPKGRFGPSRTLQYLNRAYPKGRGVSNMLLKLTWG